MSARKDFPNGLEKLKGARVLVTGGAGFLGANLCIALAELGAHVTAVDAFLTNGGANAANLAGANVQLVRADIRNFDMRNLCEDVRIIFNLAALTSHMGGQADPLSDLDVNAVGQLRLIAAVREAAPKAVVVHASTRQFYGRPRSLPVDESHLVAPVDANGVSKFAGEQYWMLENRLHGRRVVSLRLTNCYGPRLRIRDARQGFLAYWIRNALLGETFEVWGGDQIRDLTFVSDVTEAFLLAATTSACHGQVFNIGGLAPITLRALADMLVSVAGSKTRYVVCNFPGDRARIDIGSYYADDALFRRATGWMPRVGVIEGLTRSIDWFMPRLEDYL
jgi:nucleoside-diphosphate-sugar epimerase